ncbi:MAG: heterocyst frequency control protein PatD [Pleurocapsa sp. MO_192.B19]|nr:heterocyst frequency control protein PatD [Pleurocapsa sp. MO_192.B19]
MLNASYDRAYQDFLTLLTDFKSFLINPEVEVTNSHIQQQFQKLAQWFDNNIVCLDQQELEQDIVARWQSVQTEIKREFKLLTTDILFLASARQNVTRTKRLQSISDRTTKLIGYCQIMLKSNNSKSDN